MRGQLDRGIRDEKVWHGTGTREGEGVWKAWEGQEPGSMQEPGDRRRGVGRDSSTRAWDGAGA